MRLKLLSLSPLQEHYLLPGSGHLEQPQPGVIRPIVSLKYVPEVTEKLKKTTQLKSAIFFELQHRRKCSFELFLK